MAAPVPRVTRTKRAAETVTFPFDFTPVLAAGSVIQGDVAITAQTGLTVEAAAVTPVAAVASAQVSGGETGDDYWLKALALADTGDAHELEYVVLIRDEN